MTRKRTDRDAIEILQRFRQGQGISHDDWKSSALAREDELAAAFRDPNKWSFVVRDPAGRVVGYGEADTRS